jgi:hypothetical protein
VRSGKYSGRRPMEDVYYDDIRAGQGLGLSAREAAMLGGSIT